MPLFATMTRMTKAKAFSDRITWHRGPMTFSIMHEMVSRNPLPYAIVIQGAQRPHGLLYQTLPHIIPALSTYVVTPMASLHRHTARLRAFFFQMRPV